MGGPNGLLHDLLDEQSWFNDTKCLRNVPTLDRNPQEWFRYWDEDGNGSLDKQELIRALCRTFCVTKEGKPTLSLAFEMRELVENFWVANRHGPFDALSFEEFSQPCGLMDQFVHNHSHCM